MKLIVGLGNPGREYQNTRHSTGFMIIDEYAKKKGLTNSKEKFNGCYFEGIAEGEKFILLKPQAYMNLSGEIIRKYVDYFNISLEDVFIIYDDLDLEIGTYKLRLCGGSGGHNGIKNIISNLNTEEFKRMRIGISNNKDIDTKDYVLGHFNNEEKDVLKMVIDTSEQIIDDFFKLSFTNLMNKYNK